MYTDPCTIAMQSDMNQLKELIQEDLATFMDEMAPPLEICVDWVCDRFALDCDDAPDALANVVPLSAIGL